MSSVHPWLTSMETCLGNLFALLHYGSGKPDRSRGTKLSILCWVNTLLHPRNFFWFGSLLNIVTLYNKTQINTESQRLISCSLEPHVGHLFVKWVILIVPTLVCLAASLQVPSVEVATHFYTLTFTSITKQWDLDYFSSILS